MRSVAAWSRPKLSPLPGAPVPVRVRDTAAESVRTIDPSRPVTMYVCGITPYDATHLGHAATYVAFDTLLRAIAANGVEVRYSQNITDVDDPLLERAAATGRDWRELAQSETDRFRGDMAALRVVPPDTYVRVQDIVPEIAEAVSRLIDRGFGYAVPTPDVAGEDRYLDLAAVQRAGIWRLGAVSHFSPEALSAAFVEFGGDPRRPGKRSALDPLLWRAERPGEPTWPAPFGSGRPGWHVECALIATETLGATVTIQGGGKDLRFPHHEMTAAHAEALTGERFAEHYVHAGLVAYEGEKMSKSLGNLVLVSSLRSSGVDPAAIRLAVLAHRYRDDWEWRDDTLDVARGRLARWRAAAARAREGADDDAVGIRRAIADDLDTPSAIARVDAWAERPEPSRAVVPAVDALLGIDLRAQSS